MKLSDAIGESFSEDELRRIAVVLEDAGEDEDDNELRELSARFWSLVGSAA